MSLPKSESFWIKHLLRRAGFDASPEELSRYKSLGYEGTLSELLNPERVDNSKLENQILAQNFDYTTAEDLKRWWLYRMTFTRRPLEEKMTLFWHGHFATAAKKVNNDYFMYGQNLLFRRQALGNFRDLVLSVSKDPAMIIWLDNQQNKKAKPNENYAREIMELFTLGIGNYTESDVKEAARAFTGWQTLPSGFFFNQRQHDYGAKTVLGISGDLNGDDVVAILAKHPATARFIARKLVKFFVSDNPDQAMINRLAAKFSAENGNMRETLRALFTDSVFTSEQSYHSKIKSPVELVVGTIKTMQMQQLNGDLPLMLARMGQDLFMPPNVKGWDGGTAWIATDTMMERFNFAGTITGEKFDEIVQYTSASQLMSKQKINSAGKMVDYFLCQLVDNDVPLATRNRLVAYVSSNIKGQPLLQIPDNNTLEAKLRGLVRLIMSLPTYQLA